MLTFFRKYQKFIFVFTTAIIILSFTFFGTMSSMGGSPEVKEEFLVKAIDGSSISVQKVNRMVQFLSSSHMDLKDDRARSVNLMNDGVLEKRFLQTSLGKLLAEKISSEIGSDIEKTVEKAVAFQPYRHETAPFISAESVWAQFAPESVRIVSELMTQSSSLSSLKKFDLLSQGFLQHQMVPTGFVRKVLAYQEEQAAHAGKDASLPYADVSLLGLHSAKEWLGESYLRAVSQVIINSAAYARKQGYTVSSQEARQAMVLNVKEAATLISKEVTPQTNFYQVFLGQVRNLGMNEQECIDLWKDIALFQKLFEVSSETLEPKDLQSMSKEQALTLKYSLPSHLQFRDFSSLMKLQIYIDAVSLKKRSKENLLSLPTEFNSLVEIEKKAPDLIQREYVLEFAELDLKKVALQIGLKETWNWQTQDLGWNLLKKQYSYLNKESSLTKEARFAALEALDSKQRLEIDKFSREQILAKDIERIKKELHSLPVETKSFSISSQGIELPFKGVTEMQGLVSLLEAAPLKENKSISPAESDVQTKINFYTGDKQHYYKINVIKRSSLKKIQTFAEANASGALRRMLDKKLEDAYLEVRKKDPMPYTKKDGSWKPLSEVKEKVGLAFFAPVLKAISLEFQALSGKEPSKEQLESADFYAQHWMLFHMKTSLSKGEEALETEDRLVNQWNLLEQKETVVKKQNDELSSFAFVEGSWSPILALSSGKPCFFKVLQNLPAALPSEAEIEKLLEPLRKEKENKLFNQVFSEIDAKKALSFKVFL